MQLEAQVEDIQENQTTTSNEEVVGMRKKLKEQIQKNQEKDNMLTKQRETSDDIETKLSACELKIQDLFDQLTQKDEEKNVMEARYKKYLEKAKSVSIKN